MSPDMMHALAISGSILLAVVILITVVAIVTVRRGEAGITDSKHSRHL